MRALLQRVTQASVAVDGETVGAAGEGYLILLGVMQGDTDAQAEKLAEKTAMLRVFEDGAGKMNRSLLDIGGDALVVSQFTLCADTRKGRRPSFTNSAAPEEANRLYALYVEKLRELGVSRVETGVFAAHMQVSLINNGPVTILLDTDEWSST
ncbi:MAG: D-tyrosyl-tRNA(Tyr) deacylase [Clostridiales bacterium]|nr:D-tyrosyl-tRNA(Tyr) deacylase [Clostridiales bacterium]